MTEYWISLNNFRYDYSDIIFVLRHLGMMSEGQWPPNPEGTGYIDEPLATRSKKHRSKVPMASAIAGEIELKLGWCELDGLLADAFYHYGIPIDRLARVARMGDKELLRRIDRAISFVSFISQKPKRYKVPSYEDFIK